MATPSNFFKLPYELRQMIYRYIFRMDLLNLGLESSDIHPPPGHHDSSTNRDITRALLLVCKLTHAEASLVLYSENTFYVQGIEYCKLDRLFISCIGPMNSALITRIWLDLKDPYDPFRRNSNQVTKWASSLPRLRELQLVRSRGTPRLRSFLAHLEEIFNLQLPTSAPGDPRKTFQSFIDRMKKALESDGKRTWKLIRGGTARYIRFVAQGTVQAGLKHREIETTVPSNK
ncbi:hypothetical protein MMC14_007050 [Varicellaria rhodocarpa]|nr:hypothetical protein [Varicellaria rhodocarpa]